jgi:CBS domain-containing protein
MSQLQIANNPRLAKDLMTRQIITIGPDDSLEHLEDHMRAMRFRHLPVVEHGKLVGLISQRDLLHASSSFLSDRAKERDVLIHQVPARRIMQTEMLTVGPDEPLTEVARLMWEAKIGCAPVVDEQHALLGLITESDFLRLAYHFLAARLAEPVDAEGPPPPPRNKPEP